MTRVSSNAGKHSYLRPENDYLFNEIRDKEKGIPIDFSIKPKFNIKIDTEYKDKKKRKIFFKDIVVFKDEEYSIIYNPKEFYWIMEKCSDPQKQLKLKEYAKLVIIK